LGEFSAEPLGGVTRPVFGLLAGIEACVCR
jgi:hypothetical protein